MLILVSGLPYFSKKIVEDLNKEDSYNNYVFLNTYESFFAQLQFIISLPFAGAVISFNGVSSPSKSLDWVLRFRKPLIMQWHGSDVKFAVERALNGTIEKKYILASKHLTSAPWFQEELKNVVDDVTYAPFGYINTTGNREKYEEVSILTYLAEGKEDFYGWKEIEFLAKEMPEVPIYVVGVEGKCLTAPSNVTFLGWIPEDELLNWMKKCSIFIRLTEHDGKAISVSQALSVGAEVIWTYPFDQCHHSSKDGESLLKVVKSVEEKIVSRGMLPNQENIAYAKRTLLRKAVLNNYITILKSKLNA